MSAMTEEYEALCVCPGHAGRSEHHTPCHRRAAPEAFLCATCYRGKPLCWNRACPTAPEYPHTQQESCPRDLPFDQALL
jgi:hypothetical protein